MGKKRPKLRGTNRDDELFGTRQTRQIYGLGGDDLISPAEGKCKVWGGDGKDTFETLDGGKGFMKIMDFEVVDKITFCGCPSTRIEQRGKNAWILKGTDVKAVVKGILADELDIDLTNKVISMVSDPLF